MTKKGDQSLLVSRKIIAASPERVFDAWTDPEQLLQWWGPMDVQCIEAKVDLRIGGQYRLGNKLPDGSVITITGEFETIEHGVKLVYLWKLEGLDGNLERVIVEFNSLRGGAETEVIVTHHNIADRETRVTHAAGWAGCLEGLKIHFAN